MKYMLAKKLKDEKGAVERVLVTILLVILGVGLFIGLSAWVTSQNSEVQNIATIKIDQAIQENSN